MRQARRLAIVLASLLSLLAPASPTTAAVPLSLVKSGFDRPIYLTHAGDSRLFVVEQSGRIKVIDGAAVHTFLNLSSLVTTAASEQGLLGLAFHPGYASNGLFYVNYTRRSDGATVVAEYRRSTFNSADQSSARILLTIRQPYANHNAGWMGFKGKLLYIATGDGGSAGDPGNRAQSRSTLLGKILRINPLDPDGSGPKRYSLPAKNPFVGRAGLDEIWSFGLRNPWRCSFDRGNGRMWCADVGQAKWEEVNRVRTGKRTNYGWRVMEGRSCYSPPSGCNTSGKLLPVAVYSHAGGNCAVTGGYVSRRSGAAMYGKYIYGDYCSGRIWTMPAGGGYGSASMVADTGHLISSFGEGRDGRLYLVDYTGSIYRLSDS